MIIAVIVVSIIIGAIVGFIISKVTGWEGEILSGIYVFGGMMIGIMFSGIVSVCHHEYLEKTAVPCTTEVQLQEINDTGKYVVQTINATGTKGYKVQPIGEDAITCAKDKCIVHYMETENPYAVIIQPSEELKFWYLADDISCEIYLNDESQME